MARWIRYSEQAPDSPGVYWFRGLNSRIEGLEVTFPVKVKKLEFVTRGDLQPILIPEIAFWEYKEYIMPECSWFTQPCAKTGSKYSFAPVFVKGISFARCPYCGKVPQLIYRPYYSGRYIYGTNPLAARRWALRCCAWGNSPTISDPFELERIRRKAFNL